MTRVESNVSSAINLSQTFICKSLTYYDNTKLHNSTTIPIPRVSPVTRSLKISLFLQNIKFHFRLRQELKKSRLESKIFRLV